MKTFIHIQIIILFLSTGLLPAQSDDRNYIRVITPKKSTAQISSLPAADLLDDVNYIDGLGRALQTVKVGYSPDEHDVVRHYDYDRLGRTPKQYYDYASDVSGGDYREEALSELEAFYQNTHAVANTAYPWSEKVYDDTPLNRLIEIAGNGKAIADDNQRTVRLKTSYNKTDQVRYLYTSMSTGEVRCEGFYDKNELTIMAVHNENNQLIEYFSDKLGKYVLKCEYFGNDTLMTYFVYDDFGLLRFVIPPEGSRELDNYYGSGDWQFNSIFLDTWVYQYQYDDRKRLIEKKLPGMDEPVYMVYDEQDKLVLTQDPNLRSENKWTYTKYDELKRPVMIGFYEDAVHTSRSAMQDHVNNFVDGTNTFFHERHSDQNYATQHGYSNHAFPNQNTEVLQVNYYDDHDFDRDGQQDHSYQPDGEYASNEPYNHTRGVMTGFKVKMLDGSGWNQSVYFIDEFLRLIQIQGENYLGGTDTIHLAYNFSGLITHSKIVHSKDNSPSSTYTVRYTPEYDHAFRLKQWKHQLNDQDEIVLSEMKYNEMAQLIEKNLHVFNSGTDQLQSTDYRYNIHGEMTFLNNSDLKDDMGTTNDDEDDLFGMEFHYEDGLPELNGTEQYNGNISGITWRAMPDSVKRGYGYQYDELSRLTEASYAAYNDMSQTWTDEVNNYSLFDITYDYHGNIKSLKRRGYYSGGGGGFGMMDDLSYTYTGNKLFNVDDAAAFTETYDFNDHGSKMVSEFFYDANGNMVRDDNKDIEITYNYLNLPDTVDFGSGKKISYLYDASGRKWKKTVMENGVPDANLYYHGIFIYNNSGLEFVSTSEGRAVPDPSLGGEFRYEYHFRDHQGNVRLRYSDLNGDGTIDPDQEVIQQAHYYPFGMEMRGLQTAQIGPEHAYKFNQKEMIEDHGLYWYDYGLRNYDPQIGRWHSIDPVSDMFTSQSPYNYAFNNPVRYIDPDGACPEESTPINPADCPDHDWPSPPMWWDYSQISKYYEAYINLQLSINYLDVRPPSPVIDGYNENNPQDNTAIRVEYYEYTSFNNGSQQEGSWVQWVPFYEWSKEIGDFSTKVGIVAGDGLFWAEEIIRSNYRGHTPYALIKPPYPLPNIRVKMSVLKGARSFLKGTGAVTGGLGVIYTAVQYGQGEISGTEATFDIAFGIIGFIGPVGATISIVYFATKLTYETISGDTLFAKPNPKPQASGP